MEKPQDKKMIFDKIEEDLKTSGFLIQNKDEDRPWGGFFVIDENQSQEFSDSYFDKINVDELKVSGKLSPKILVINPNTRLSWQYHHRRSEVWRVIEGSVGVKRSFTDEESEMKTLNRGDQIKLEQGERHRLIGLNDWAIVAEIWQHTNADNPSDENDIIRVQDDFGR